MYVLMIMHYRSCFYWISKAIACLIRLITSLSFAVTFRRWHITLLPVSGIPVIVLCSVLSFWLWLLKVNPFHQFKNPRLVIQCHALIMQRVRLCKAGEQQQGNWYKLLGCHLVYVIGHNNVCYNLIRFCCIATPTYSHSLWLMRFSESFLQWAGCVMVYLVS